MERRLFAPIAEDRCGAKTLDPLSKELFTSLNLKGGSFMWTFLFFVLIILLAFGLISWIFKAVFLVAAIALLYYAIRYIDKSFDAAADRNRLEEKRNG